MNARSSRKYVMSAELSVGGYEVNAAPRFQFPVLLVIGLLICLLDQLL